MGEHYVDEADDFYNGWESSGSADAKMQRPIAVMKERYDPENFITDPMEQWAGCSDDDDACHPEKSKNINTKNPASNSNRSNEEIKSYSMNRPNMTQSSDSLKNLTHTVLVEMCQNDATRNDRISTESDHNRIGKICVINMRLSTGFSFKSNFEYAMTQCEVHAKQGGLSMIVLPQLFVARNMGILENTHGICAMHNEILNRVSYIAKTYQVYIAWGTLYEDLAHQIRNAVLIVDRKGDLVHVHHQILLSKTLLGNGISPGDEFKAVHTEFGTLAVSIGLDMHQIVSKSQSLPPIDGLLIFGPEECNRVDALFCCEQFRIWGVVCGDMGFHRCLNGHGEVTQESKTALDSAFRCSVNSSRVYFHGIFDTALASMLSTNKDIVFGGVEYHENVFWVEARSGDRNVVVDVMKGLQVQAYADYLSECKTTTSTIRSAIADFLT